MINDLEKIKNKIKKLFALSRSSNANEAAIALEMAQKLMIEHGIKRNAVGEFEIIKENFKGNCGKKPPIYQTYLTSSIAGAFGCESAYGFLRPKSELDPLFWGHSFVGLEHRVQIAVFIAEVLLRKMKKTRNDYMKKLTRVRIRTNKIKRADDFCLGWVHTVVNKLNKFTNTPDEQSAIDIYVADLKWGDNLKTIDRGAVKGSGVNDFFNGRKAAANVQIQHGVEGNESEIALLEAMA